MKASVITGAARTAIGKLGGALSHVPAVELGARAVEGALERSGVAPAQVDYVIMGHVLQAGTGQITARQAARGAGIPVEVPAVTVNKVCLSGLTAIALADQLIRAGEVSVVVAGGMEAMDRAPYLLPQARFGYRMGTGELVDSMIYDGLWDAFTDRHMGDQSDDVNRELRISREQQDAWAARSHSRAHDATTSGRFAEEIVPVQVARHRQDPLSFATDEGIRSDATPETMAALRPVFQDDGTITAGNASQISSGAAATVVMSPERAHELGVRPRAEILAHGMSAADPPYLHTVPALALEAALKKVGMPAGALDLLEINEAFASVALHSTRMLLGEDPAQESKVNVNGGAVALGHPIGATGARLAVTLIHELARRGGGTGAACLCGGGGQGDAVIFKVPGR